MYQVSTPCFMIWRSWMRGYLEIHIAGWWDGFESERCFRESNQLSVSSKLSAPRTVFIKREVLPGPKGVPIFYRTTQTSWGQKWSHFERCDFLWRFVSGKRYRLSICLLLFVCLLLLLLSVCLMLRRCSCRKSFPRICPWPGVQLLIKNPSIKITKTK